MRMVVGSWRGPSVVVLAAGMVVGGLFGGPPAAGTTKAAKPTATIALSTGSADAGSALAVSWSVTRRPKGAKVTLERTFGTAGTFRSIATLAGRAGTFSTVVPPMGRYTYRVVERNRSGKVLAKSTAQLYSFGDIRLWQNNQTVQVGTSLFRYSYQYGSDFDSRVWSLDATSCRRIDLTAAKTGDNPAGFGRVSVIQESGDPYYLQVPVGAVVSGSTPLSGGAVQVQIWDTAGDDGYTYIDGTLNCWTTTGTP